MAVYYEFLKFEIRLFLKAVPLLTGLYILTVFVVVLLGNVLRIESITSIPIMAKLKAIILVYLSIIGFRLWLIIYNTCNDVRLYRKMKFQNDWGLWFEVLIIGIPYTLTVFGIVCTWEMSGSSPFRYFPIWANAGLFFVSGWVAINISRQRVSPKQTHD